MRLVTAAHTWAFLLDRYTAHPWAVLGTFIDALGQPLMSEEEVWPCVRETCVARVTRRRAPECPGRPCGPGPGSGPRGPAAPHPRAARARRRPTTGRPARRRRAGSPG